MSNMVDRDPDPELAYVKSVRPFKTTFGRFVEMAKSGLANSHPDQFNEVTFTLIEPGPVECRFNGGAWWEQFGVLGQDGNTLKPHLEHTHHDDNRGASKRYIMLLPVGSNGIIDVLESATERQERYLILQDHLSFFVFDGTLPHRFSIAGGKEGRKKGNVLLAVAFHVRDVAVSTNALVEQTDIYEPGIKKWSTASIDVFPPPEIPEIPGRLDRLINLRLDSSREAIGKADHKTAALELSGIALMVQKAGVGYGNPKEAEGQFELLNSWRAARTAESGLGSN